MSRRILSRPSAASAVSVVSECGSNVLGKQITRELKMQVSKDSGSHTPTGIPPACSINCHRLLSSAPTR